MIYMSMKYKSYTNNFGKWLAKFRKSSHRTQQQLGDKRESNVPSTEVLIRLAEAFNVSLDYLAFEAKRQTARVNIQDQDLLRRFEALDSLSGQEKTLATETLAGALGVAPSQPVDIMNIIQ